MQLCADKTGVEAAGHFGFDGGLGPGPDDQVTEDAPGKGAHCGQDLPRAQSAPMHCMWLQIILFTPTRSITAIGHLSFLGFIISYSTGTWRRIVIKAPASVVCSARTR